MDEEEKDVHPIASTIGGVNRYDAGRRLSVDRYGVNKRNNKSSNPRIALSLEYIFSVGLSALVIVFILTRIL